MRACFLWNSVFFAGEAGDIADTVQNDGGLIGIGLSGFSGGDTGENQNRICTGFQTGNDVSVHAVADDDGFVGVAAKHPQAGTHHERVGFAAKIGLLAGGQFNGSDKRAAGGGNAAFNGAGDIGVGTDQLGTGHDQIGGLGQRFQRVGLAFADDLLVGIDIVHRDAGVVERIMQSGSADGVDGAARSLTL